LTARRWVTAFVVCAKYKDYLIPVRVAEEPSEKWRLAKSKLEQAITELTTELGPAYSYALVLEDCPHRGPDCSSLRRRQIVTQPVTDRLTTVRILVKVNTKGRSRHLPQGYRFLFACDSGPLSLATASRTCFRDHFSSLIPAARATDAATIAWLVFGFTRQKTIEHSAAGQRQLSGCLT